MCSTHKWTATAITNYLISVLCLERMHVSQFRMEERLVPRRCWGSLPTNSTVRVKNRDSLSTGIHVCTQSDERREGQPDSHSLHTSFLFSCRKGHIRLWLKGLSLNLLYTNKGVYVLRMELQEKVCISSFFQISFPSCHNFWGASALGKDSITDAQRCPQTKRHRKCNRHQHSACSICVQETWVLLTSFL